MNKTIENVNETRKKILVSFDAAEVAAEKENVIAEYVQYAKVPGFRAGKAPKAMITQRFSADINSQLEHAITNKAVAELNKISEFDVFSVVDLNHGDISAADGVTFDFVADIYPDIKLPEDYKTVVELPATEATEEEIQKTVDFYRNQRAQYVEVDRPVVKGDFVQVSYEGKIGDELVEKVMEKAAMFGSQKNTWEEAGNLEVPGVPSIVEGVIGMKKGDKKTIEHKFADDFEDKNAAGKTAVYEVELLDIREKKLAEINEEFLKILDAETEEEFREKLAKDITAQKTQHNEVQKRQKAVENLLEKMEFALPESAVEEEKNGVLQEMMMRFMQQGADHAALEENTKGLLDAAAAEATPRAKMRVFLNRVAKANDLKVTDEDMSRVLWQEAMRNRMRPEELIKQLKKDQARVNRMRSDALLQKAINFIAEKTEVKIEEKKD